MFGWIYSEVVYEFMMCSYRYCVRRVHVEAHACIRAHMLRTASCACRLGYQLSTQWQISVLTTAVTYHPRAYHRGIKVGGDRPTAVTYHAAARHAW